MTVGLYDLYVYMLTCVIAWMQWSFGVLMWELVTRGAVPYADIENWEVANFVQSSKRLQQPLYCPDSV